MGQQIFILVNKGKIIYTWKTLLIDQSIGESMAHTDYLKICF